MRAQLKANAAIAGTLAAALAFTGIQPAAAETASQDLSTLVSLAEAEYVIDSDNDGLPDDWETGGVVLKDGTEVPLQDWGVDPNRPDLFLQLNWMASHNGESFAPSAQALQDIVDLFDEHGIALHIDAGETFTNIPNYTEYHGGQTLPYSEFYFNGEVTGVRLLNDIETHLGERSNVFRLGLIGERIDRRDQSTGVALVGDNAFFVAKNSQISNDEQLRNSILHEFGHTLGLRHNGAADVTRKLPRTFTTSPDYVSVMNYGYQFSHFNYSERGYTAEGANGPIEVPADWDALVLNTPRIGHDAIELGASFVSHGAPAEVEDRVEEQVEVEAEAPAQAPAQTNVAAIIGSVVAVLAVLGIAGAVVGLLPIPAL